VAGIVLGLVSGPGLFSAGKREAQRTRRALWSDTSYRALFSSEPPPELFARPDAVLIAWRTRGLVCGLGFGIVSGLVCGVVGGVRIGLLVGLGTGTVIGLQVGLYVWSYHYWLRYWLQSHGTLPRRLPAFLRWCAEPQRGWLRITDAYEFRHRELLDHLASSPSSATFDE
jgi:hypothetical protein